MGDLHSEIAPPWGGRFWNVWLVYSTIAALVLVFGNSVAFAQAAGEDADVVGETVTFESVVERALSSSAVAAAGAQVVLARQALAAANYPIAANASGGVRSLTDFGDQGTDVELDLAVNAGIRVAWGATAEAIAAAERSLAAAIDAVEAARANAVVQAMRLYAGAGSATVAHEIAEIELEIAGLQYEAVRSRYAAGAAIAADVTNSEINEKSAELDLRGAEGTLAAALAELSLFVGIEVVSVAGDLPEVPFAGAAVSEVALTAREDVRAAQRQLEAAADVLAQARRVSGVNITASASLAGTLGSTSLTVGASIDTHDLTPGVNGRLSTTTAPPRAGAAPALGAVLGVGASVPLGGPDTRVAAAELAYAQAGTRLAAVIAQAELEVVALATRVALGAARLELAASRAALAQAAYEAERTRFELGAVGMVEVLRAQVAAVTATDGVQAARTNYLLDLVALYVASGRPVLEVFR